MVSLLSLNSRTFRLPGRNDLHINFESVRTEMFRSDWTAYGPLEAPRFGDLFTSIRSFDESTKNECRLDFVLRPKSCVAIARYQLLILTMCCVACSPQNKGEKYHSNRNAQSRYPPPRRSIRPKLTNIHTKCALDTIRILFGTLIQ